MRRPSITWKGLIYYGEVFGFLLAWLGGAALIAQQATNDPTEQAWDQVASIEVALPSEPAVPLGR